MSSCSSARGFLPEDRVRIREVPRLQLKKPAVLAKTRFVRQTLQPIEARPLNGQAGARPYRDYRITKAPSN